MMKKRTSYTGRVSRMDWSDSTKDFFQVQDSFSGVVQGCGARFQA